MFITLCVFNQVKSQCWLLVVLCGLITLSWGYSFTELAPTYTIPSLVHHDWIPKAKFYIPHGLTMMSEHIGNQFHTKLGSGQVSYGHTEQYQSHAAVQDAAGNKVGSFSYVKPDGKIARTDYVADALGYRVASNDLPIDSRAINHPIDALHIARYRRDISTPASTTLIHHAVPVHTPIIHTPLHTPLLHHSAHTPLIHTHTFPLVKRESSVSKSGVPHLPYNTRYPQPNSEPNSNPPPRNLYTNTQPGQEYASHYHTN